MTYAKLTSFHRVYFASHILREKQDSSKRRSNDSRPHLKHSDLKDFANETPYIYARVAPGIRMPDMVAGHGEQVWRQRRLKGANGSRSYQ